MSECNRAAKSRGLQLADCIDAINRRIGVYVSQLILAMTLISAANAVSRNAFSVSSNAFFEIQWYLFAAFFLLAAAYTLRRTNSTSKNPPRILCSGVSISPEKFFAMRSNIGTENIGTESPKHNSATSWSASNCRSNDAADTNG